jgi:TfoX/Sxy family transcriptional regulator of competence genes
MAYNEELASRVRKALGHIPQVEEKVMFSGFVFMVNGKMCVNVSHDDLMCRIDPAKQEEALNRPGVRAMVMNGKTMKSYVYVSEEGFASSKDFDYWINLCLEYNKKAKASKKKAVKKKA